MGKGGDVWTPVAIAATIAVITGGILAIEFIRIRRFRPGWTCHGCGYDRRGLDGLAPCPECGRAPA